MSGSKSENRASKAQERKRVYNRIVRGRTRTALRTAREAVAAGDAEKAGTITAAAVSSIDRAVSKGVYHKNKAARLKSRLTKQTNKLTAAQSSS